MTRIIAGTAGGRRLQTPTGDATRPTSDRVREALFSALESAWGSLEGLRVLDLYAGSGALALEALSRGAAAATMVERDRHTAALIATNIKDLDLPRGVVVNQSVQRFLHQPCPLGYDVVLADPPYPLTEQELAADLVLLVERGWLRPGAMVVIERSKRSPEPGWPSGLHPTRRKDYGETALWYADAVEVATPSAGAADTDETSIDLTTAGERDE